MLNYNFNAIATIRSCYKEKFGIPRQPGLVNSPAQIEIDASYSKDDAFRELESFSHIWVIFLFHGVNSKSWKSTVRPPRLGGNQRVGVFATRSMFRPNPIGLSVVELESVERSGSNIILNIRGGDFLDGTPVLDIKPYLPYVDVVNMATAGYALEKPEIKFKVIFSPQATKAIKFAEINHPKISNIIVEVLQIDPRPAYQTEKTTKSEFAIKLYDYDIKWCVENEKIIVTDLILIE